MATFKDLAWELYCAHENATTRAHVRTALDSLMRRYPDHAQELVDYALELADEALSDPDDPLWAEAWPEIRKAIQAL
jgi:hypothetical protein